MEKKRDVITIDIVRPTGPRVIPEPLRSRGYLERYVPRRSISRLKQGAVAVASFFRRPRVSAAAATITLAVCVHLATSTITHFVARPFWTFTASNKAAMDPAPAASYQGPGNALSSTATIWGSCARVYNAALASTSTSLCDLVDTSVGGTAICTLRGSSTGFVDLTGNYCTGSTTPAAACAAAAGGACRVSKVYDQIGGTSGWSNATNSQRPVLTFSAQNSLPGMTCTAAANCFLVTTATFSVSAAAPYTMLGVAKRTANFTTQQAVMGWSSTPNAFLGFHSSASTAIVTSNTVNNLTQGSVADSSFHFLLGVVDASTNGVIHADGTETTGTTGTDGPSSNTLRFGRAAGGISLDGVIMEIAYYNVAMGSSDRAAYNTNARSSTNGYNF